MQNRHNATHTATTTRTEAGVVAALFVFVFAVMLVVSKDSWLHDIYHHYDSAWFFMCGKAWMNGLTPYVDFSDSKGPLLWIIYGGGYLISPRNYVGVFWLSCVAWTATLWLSYRSALIITANRRRAFLTALFVAIAGLNPIVHNETRCEDFAMPFVALVIYVLCRLSTGVKRRATLWLMAALGTALAATFLMKFNITAMLLPFALLALMLVPHNAPVTRVRAACCMLAGGVAMLLPFAVCFAIEGNLTDFVNEYLLLTSQTTANTGAQENTLQTLLSLTGLYAVAVFGICSVAMAKLMPRHKRTALLCNIVFFAICSINSRSYYYSIYAPFAVYAGCMAASCRLSPTGRKSTVVATVGVAAVLALSNLYIHDLRHSDYGDFFTQDNQARHECYAMERIIAQVPNARIVHFRYTNVGICSGVLPACKYWATQWGATDAMWRNQTEACRDGKADFAVVPTTHANIINELVGYGWHVCDVPHGVFEAVLLARHKPRPMPRPFNVTNYDVLTKRRIDFAL